MNKEIKIPEEFLSRDPTTFKPILRRDIVDWLSDHGMYDWDIKGLMWMTDNVIVLDDSYDDTLFILTWL